MPRESAFLLIIVATLGVAQTSVVEEARLTASDGGPDDFFGCSVALSGNIALVGASRNDGDRGAAYVFVRSGTTWSHQAKLLAPDGVTGDGFGGSLALRGDTALIGAGGDDSGRGAAYVFVRSGTIWTQQAKLQASDGMPGDFFGTVALSGNTALIGALGDDGWGAAYVFVRSGTTWIQQAKLKSFTSAGNRFGESVALSGDTALIADTSFDGLRGAAYVFVRIGNTWRLQARLEAPGGVENDLFAWSVALFGNVAMTGSYAAGGSSGAAWAFVRNGSTWTYANCCHPSEPTGSLGVSLALSPFAAIFGATGAAYVLPRGSSEYIKLVPSHSEDGGFGFSVALSRDTALVGAPSSAAYVFRTAP